MASWFSRNDWESALSRWDEAGLLGDESVEAIRAWETEREAESSASRLVDALSYLGVSIALVGAFLAVGLMDSNDDGRVFVPLGMGLVAGFLARSSWHSGLRAVSDGLAASTVILLSLALGLALELVGDGDQYALGFFLICLCALLVGGAMVRLTRSRLTTLLAAIAVGLMPFSFDRGRQQRTRSVHRRRGHRLADGMGTVGAHSLRSSELAPWRRSRRCAPADC